EREPAAIFAGAARIFHQIERDNATGEFSFQDLDRRDVQVAGMGGDRRAAVVAVAAAISRAEDFVLKRRLAGPAAILPRDQHGTARAAIGAGACKITSVSFRLAAW